MNYRQKCKRAYTGVFGAASEGVITGTAVPGTMAFCGLAMGIAATYFLEHAGRLWFLLWLAPHRGEDCHMHVSPAA